MISVQNISKSFGDVKAVDDISFDINPGEVVGFLGPNGAGKSTTMRMLTGYLSPDVGAIKVNEIDIAKHPVQAKRHVGYLPESAALYFEMITFDFLLFVGRMRGLKGKFLKERIGVVAKQCQILDVLGRKISELSKGYKQRVGLAQALLHDPKILVLDEPTVGLDPNQIVEIRELIKEIGKTKTILLSTHILSEVSATCQRVLIIKQGKIIAQGTPASLMGEANQQSIYRISVRAELAMIKKQFASFPHFKNLEILGADDDIHHLLIHCNGGKDLSEDIFDLAVANRWRLSQLVRENRSLEDVFKELTG